MLTMMTLSAVAALSGGIQEYAPSQERAPQQDGGPQRVAPRGSYTQSCSGDYVNQGRLYADCRDERGRLRGTSISPSSRSRNSRLSQTLTARWWRLWSWPIRTPSGL